MTATALKLIFIPFSFCILFFQGCINAEAEEKHPFQAERITYPLIHLNGNRDDTVFISEPELAYRPATTPYTDPGAVVQNINSQFKYNEDIPVRVSGTVNTDLPGIYILTYHAWDVAGNEAAVVTRTVHVINNRASFLNGIYNVACSCTAAIAGSSQGLVSSEKYIAVVAAGSANSSFNISMLQLGSERVLAKASLSGSAISLSYFSQNFRPSGAQSGTLSASRNSFTLETVSIQLSSAYDVSYWCKNVYTISSVKNN